MKEFTRIAAQGDLLIIRVDDLPEGLVEATPEGGKHILAHSETGHHHTVPAGDVTVLERPNDPLAAGMKVLRECALIHERPFDTHEPIRLEPGNYLVRRQREYTPEGYRRVED